MEEKAGGDGERMDDFLSKRVWKTSCFGSGKISRPQLFVRGQRKRLRRWRRARPPSVCETDVCRKLPADLIRAAGMAVDSGKKTYLTN